MILTSIKSFFASQKLLFIIFILLQIFAVVSTQYAYIGIIEQENDRRIYVDDATLFIVEFSESTKINDIKTQIDEIVLSYDKKLASISIDSVKNYLRAYFFGQNEVVNYGTLNSNIDDIIISTNPDISGNVKLGETLNSYIGKFNVVGLRTDSTYNEIQLEAVTDDMDIMSINILLSYLPSVTQKNEFCKYLNALFPQANIISPIDRDAHNEALFSSKLWLTISLFILAMINILYIFRYVIYKRKTVYTVSRLCGASKKYIFFSTLFEYMIYCVFSGCIASLITKFIIIPMFYKSLYISPLYILLPLLFFFTLCICITVPILIKNSNTSMVQNKAVN